MDRSRALGEASSSALERAAELKAAAARIRAGSRGHRGAALRVAVPRAPTAGAIARRHLEAYLDGCPDAVIYDAKIAASELINNAYRHGEGAIELIVERHTGFIRIEVGDEGSTGADRVRRAKGRRGLEIVEALSLRWGAYAGSTHVWAELTMSPRVEQGG
ncbi:MAG TPA: ATP-binding protein [Solirubrobacteraceae bacterium]|nr:ATP-binding protein [Solirubrobacteraceae bacterium]